METLDQVFQVTETTLAASAATNALLLKLDRKLNVCFYLLCNLFMQRIQKKFVQNVFESIEKIKVLIDFPMWFVSFNECKCNNFPTVFSIKRIYFFKKFNCLVNSLPQFSNQQDINKIYFASSVHSKATLDFDNVQSSKISLSVSFSHHLRDCYLQEV